MFALFFGFRAGYRALRGVEGMGLGDVKLAAVAGVWLDWAFLPIVVEIAALSALAAALYAHLRGDGLRPEGAGCLSALFSRQRSGFAGCSLRGAAARALHGERPDGGEARGGPGDLGQPIATIARISEAKGDESGRKRNGFFRFLLLSFSFLKWDFSKGYGQKSEKISCLFSLA